MPNIIKNIPLLYRLDWSFKKCFSPVPLLFYILAGILTFVCVASGLDWWYFLTFRNSEIYKYLFPGVVIGGLVPLFGILLWIFIAALLRKEKLVVVGWALGQAAMLGLVISSMFKALTGRMPPPMELTANAVDLSSNFRFGLLEGGIFWGWPSSHTAVAFAMALAIITLFPRNKWVKIFALIYASYIGLGISIGIHWFSEFLAGVIFGSVIGRVVGKNFKNKLLE